MFGKDVVLRDVEQSQQQESFSTLKRKRSFSTPPPPESSRKSETPDPHDQYVPKNNCPSLNAPQPSSRTSQLGYQAIKTDESMARERSSSGIIVEPAHVSSDTETKPLQRRSPACSPTLVPYSDLKPHVQKQEVEIRDEDARRRLNPKASTTVSVKEAPASPRMVSTPPKKTPQLMPTASLCQLFNGVRPSTHKSDPGLMPQTPQSRIHVQDQEGASSPKTPNAPPVVLSGQSVNDRDMDESFTPNRPCPVKVKKPKQKSSSPGSHMCGPCNITFTRHFDLKRHNNHLHLEVESAEDKARRTCTNCNRVLSRVDATKRHVKAMPESCNYLRKQQGDKPLPVMPVEHYDACQALYFKLAEARKKPKGRKKAKPAA